MTPEILHTLGIGAQWLDPIQATFDKFKIVTRHERAAFIGQCAHECNHFKTLEENLSYSAASLQAHFHTHFQPGEYEAFAHKPEKIANRVYANRYGNRNEASGDGWLYHGRGCIQLTFHDNYWHFGQSVGMDFVKNPQLVATPMYACMSAGWFWVTHQCNRYADADDLEGLTRHVNGGLNGVHERGALTKQVYDLLS